MSVPLVEPAGVEPASGISLSANGRLFVSSPIPENGASIRKKKEAKAPAH